MDSSIANVAPIAISENVLTPAVCPLRLRSYPITAPSKRLNTSLYIEPTVLTSIEFTDIYIASHTEAISKTIPFILFKCK